MGLFAGPASKFCCRHCGSTSSCGRQRPSRSLRQVSSSSTSWQIHLPSLAGISRKRNARAARKERCRGTPKTAPSSRRTARNNTRRHYRAFKRIMKTKMSHACLSFWPTRNVEKKSMRESSRQTERAIWAKKKNSVRRRLVAMFALSSACSFRCCRAFSSPAWTVQRQRFSTRIRVSLKSGPDHQSASVDAKPLSSQTSTLGFLSFDLDDTLFPTSQVVNHANDLMIDRMNALGAPTTLSEFLDTTRMIRQQLKNPVSYTVLRKRAIAHEFDKHDVCNKNNKSDDNYSFSTVVEECFNVWLDERHAAAERFLFPQALASLAQLRQRYPDACIAAITNGRGNPLSMTSTLAPYFDFCVSGEDDNVFPERKPFSGIYEESLRQYKELYPHHNNHDDNSGERSQHIWCHVGDCLANDVGASASVGAKAVWFCEDPQDDMDSVASRISSASNHSTPKWSTASSADRDARARLSQKAKEKIAVRISCLSELPDALSELLVAT